MFYPVMLPYRNPPNLFCDYQCFLVFPVNRVSSAGIVAISLQAFYNLDGVLPDLLLMIFRYRTITLPLTSPPPPPPPPPPPSDEELSSNISDCEVQTEIQPREDSMIDAPPVDVIMQSFLSTRNDNNPQDDTEGESETDLTVSQTATLQLLSLCEQISAPLWFYDKFMATLRKQLKLGFNPKTAPSRERFLDELRKKFKCPMPTLVTTPRGLSVPIFSFLEQLQDLLASNYFDSLENLCANPSPSDRFDNVVSDGNVRPMP